jgi:predicted GNAT family acetyltransferase
MPEPDSSSVRVLDNPNYKRYEAYIGDELAGYLTYRMLPGAIEFVHTEVHAEFEGHGVGGRLAAVALDQARDRGLRVIPLCSFIAGYLERHPELSDLVDGRSPG